MASAQDLHIGVIGAGIVGASVAMALVRDGYRVTVFDPNGPGTQASFGNAGMIQTGTPVPMASPGILKAVPRMLFDRNGALVIRWRHLPVLLPWLVRFLRAAHPSTVETLSVHLAALLTRAGPAFDRMVAEADADSFIVRRGMLYVFRSEAERQAVQWEFDLFARRGVAMDALGAGDLRDMEPALHKSYSLAWHLKDTFYCLNPGGLTARFLRRATAAGADFNESAVRQIDVGSDDRVILRTAEAAVPVDRVVIAAGIDSRTFLKPLGVRVPLETGRGYHMMAPTPGVALNGPLIDAARHCGVVPMEHGIRIAGLMELAGRNAPPDFARARRLADLAQAMVPELDCRDAVPWMGHRPITPDSLPVIGQAPRHRNVIFAFGHGQLGFTMGPVTGEIVAALVAGREPDIDVVPYRPDRF
jgi:D-amino-acid dehydrogenase